ncbi:MAG: hypothetical protein WCY48_04210 [Candidatus Caldatribacteriota bacterium]
MKKVLSLILLVITGGLFISGAVIFQRFKANEESIIPFPYKFNQPSAEYKVEAPILIIGDRMGARMARYTEHLRDVISADIDNKIKIQSLAKPGYGLHRTIEDLKTIKKWPQILIYQGGSEEFSEVKFYPQEIPRIKTNFDRFSDERLLTLIILYPWLSRIIYEPVKKIPLLPQPQLREEIMDEEEYLRNLDTELLLFREQLKELVKMSKDRNALLILTTTPINLDIGPKKTCSVSTNIEIEKEIHQLKELLKKNDPKAAYLLSSRMVTKHIGNAQVKYLHGQISRRIGNLNEAIPHLLESTAFDCYPWRSTHLQNNIIRAVANDNQVILFDFAQLLDRDYTRNKTFVDEIYPQNLYYELGMEQLGILIKNILKL